MAGAPAFQFGRCEAMMYQCGGCGHMSALKHNVQTHLRAKCPSAAVLAQRCALFVRPVDEQAFPGAQSVGAVSGDHNVINQVVVHVHPNAVYVGSEEERQKLYGVFKDPASLRELANRAPEEIPAALFRLWKGADAPRELQNIKVVGNRVEELRGPGNVVSVPRTRFVKKTVGQMFDTVAAAGPEGVTADLRSRQFGLGKRRQVSALEAAHLHAASSREAYDLDAPGRTFIQGSSKLVDIELDHYAREAHPPF
jgi:hypothetical protein